MNNGNSVRMLIRATDESAELYHMEDAQWVEWVYLGWFVVGAAVVIWFLTMVVRKQHAWLPLMLLGLASVGLIAGGFFVQIGQGLYTDNDGTWACPSSLNAMRITEANGRKLPAGIVECRADAKWKTVVGGAMAGAGILVAVGTSSIRHRSASPSEETVEA